jgi:hypothetical protein
MRNKYEAWSPKDVQRGFRKASGEPPGRPWTTKGWSRTSFSLRENDGFQKTDKKFMLDQKNMKNKRWTHVVDKRLQKSAPKVPIFEAPPWPEYGFC